MSMMEFEPLAIMSFALSMAIIFIVFVWMSDKIAASESKIFNLEEKTKKMEIDIERLYEKITKM